MMRMSRWLILVAAIALSAAGLRADTTYTFNQTFNVDGGTIGNCNPSLGPVCNAATGSVTGTITTDGKTGVLTSSDITGFNLTYGYGAESNGMTPDYGFGGVTGTALYASPTTLFFTAGADGGATLSFVAGNGHDLIESLSDPICLDLPCSISDPPALNFFLQTNADLGITIVTGSVPFTAAIMPIATATPEPSTAILCFLGLTLIFLFRKRLGMACIRPVWPDKSGSAI